MRHGLRVWVLGILLLAGVGVGRGQTPQGGQRPTSTPYSGDLSIFEESGRDERLQVGRIMDSLRMKPGVVVADIGAGSGWLTVRAARRVAPGGEVIAEDINPESVRYIEERVKKEGLADVREVLGTPDDPKLAPGSVDVAVLLKVYHEIARPVPFMVRLRGALKPGARVGIIDRNGNGSGTDHGLPEDTVVREMGEAGFRRVARYDFTKGDGQDYFLVFQAK